jgi:hypothetical protein
MSETREPLETFNRSCSKVRCPYCGFVNDLCDTYSDLHGPEGADVECEECLKPYRAIFSVSISVLAKPIEQKSAVSHG